MYTYYCEVLVEHGVFRPGVYTFSIHPKDMIRNNHHNLIELSNWVWKETEEGVFWIKNRTRATPDKLRPDEFGEFMWAKLKARQFKI